MLHFVFFRFISQLQNNPAIARISSDSDFDKATLTFVLTLTFFRLIVLRGSPGRKQSMKSKLIAILYAFAVFRWV
jgi:hypothetical protein